MHIEKDADITKWVGETLEAMRYELPPDIEEKCPHCGVVIRYPLIARKSDIDLFQQVMASAYLVMLRHGITANLLADIRADCVIAISKGHNVK